MTQTLALLTSAPHRVLFLPGTLQLALAMGCWLALLLGAMGSLPTLPETVISAPAAHGWLMLYGIFPFFVFGFLFTAVPNWLEVPGPARADYLAVAIPMALGALLFYPGLYLPALAILAVALHLLGWVAALGALWRLLLAPPRQPPQQAAGTPHSIRPTGMIQLVPAASIDRRHARVALLACSMGALGEAAFLTWMLTDVPFALRLSASLGVWGFLTPLFLAVCHRMIPWFTSRVVQHHALFRPTGALWVMAAACLTHAALETADLQAWLWVPDAPLAVLAGWLARRWHSADAYRVRLLAMLHISFPWAGLAFTLYGIDSLARLLDTGWDLGHAPQHALGIGFFASMLFAMASRVSLGHSGRRLEADRLTWAVFWLVQLAAVLRILPELPPGYFPRHLSALSALTWLTASVAWAYRYAPFYWRARIDGKPG